MSDEPPTLRDPQAFELVPEAGEDPTRPPERRLLTYAAVAERLGLATNSVRRTLARHRVPRWPVRQGGQTLLAVDVRDVRRAYGRRIAAPPEDDPDSLDIRWDAQDSTRDTPDSTRDAQDTPPDTQDSTRDTPPGQALAVARARCDQLERGLAEAHRQLAEVGTRLGMALGEREALRRQIAAAPVGEGSPGPATRAVWLCAALAAIGMASAAWHLWGARERLREREAGAAREAQAIEAQAAALDGRAQALAGLAAAVERRQAEAVWTDALAAARVERVRADLATTLGQGLGPLDALREIALAHLRLAGGR